MSRTGPSCRSAGMLPGLAAAALAVAALAAAPASASPSSHRDAPRAPAPAAGAATRPAITVNVSVYLIKGERLVARPRNVASPGVLGGVLRQLLAGPTATERRAGLATTIPAGTRLNGVTLASGIATADLSRRFESGGGSLSMGLRLAQLTFSLTQFSQVRGVRLRLEGKPVRVFGGEGLILDHPLTRADFRSFG